MTHDAIELCRRYADILRARGSSERTIDNYLEDVLERPDARSAKLSCPRHPKRLPEVMSPQEVQAILDAAPSPKYRAAFMLCYGSGLRTSEVVHLLPRHIDSQRMLIRVERGNGQKDRQVMLSERLLAELRACWKRYAPKTYLRRSRELTRLCSPEMDHLTSWPSMAFVRQLRHSHVFP